MLIFLILGRLVFTETSGSSAVSPVFVQRGHDVTLNLTRAHVLEEGFDGLWKFNETANMVRFYSSREPSVSPAYIGRIEFSRQNHSVKLKNLQEADSGVYTARVRETEEERMLAEYRVTVQDPVSPVELKVDSVSTSSDSCNLTVTCRTQDSNISSTFTCYNKTCNQEGGERPEVTTSGASLHVYLRSDSIICNHSNQVSWTRTAERAEPLCIKKAGLLADVSVCLVKTVVLSAGLVIMIFVLISVHCAMLKLEKEK